MCREPRQRDYTLDQALVLVSASLKKLNMDFSLQHVSVAGGLHTYLCLINNHNMQLCFRGAGSGLAQEAKIKAIYEAIEDSLLYQSLSHFDDDMIRMFTTHSSPSATFLQANELLPALLTQENYLKKAYPWLKLKKLGSADNIYYPLSLLFPHASQVEYYNQYIHQAEISQAANSTGVAMGATEAEALIHGINDWIERDAYGLFLLSTMIKKNKPARCIIKQSLPDSIRKHIEILESTYDDELLVIDITTDLTIPAFFVSFTKQGVPVQPSGLGTSLCKVEALEQALFEALQARDRYNSNTIEARVKTLQHYQAYPALSRAFKCDLLQLRADGCTVEINWNSVVTHPLDQDLDAQINLITRKLSTLGMNAYYSHLFQESNGLTLMYVLLTGVETFGMMREGIFLPVKKRGKEKLI